MSAMNDMSDENFSLRQRIADLERELAAAQATIQQMREALFDSYDAVANEYENDWRHGVPTREKQLAGMKAMVDAHKAAMELPSDRTALDAMLAKKDERIARLEDAIKQMCFCPESKQIAREALKENNDD